MKKNTFGFTLAEVLITLGIIGVVAAITIPALITDYQKRATVTKLQRAISVINQAYRVSFDEVGEPESAFDLGPETYFNTYWAPYIKVLTYCSSHSVCGYKVNEPFRKMNGSRFGAPIVLEDSRVSFITPDGFFYIVYTANNPNGDGILQPFDWVLVDLNASQPPNIVGKDVFILTRVRDVTGGSVRPLCYDLTLNRLKNNCSVRDEGLCCAEYIRRSGWHINSDYPW